uniref:Major facilitator superfamily (MFS) profile domain-containing protein n=1 Tax=Timema shepardi TaxID=629360 RepID=A0A7R9G489_TIMSH|nr:unnamed protein product [Timema shepardi]
MNSKVNCCFLEQGKFHNTLMFVCGLGQIAMVCQLYLSSYLLPAAQCDFQMTAQEKGLLNSISYAGQYVGDYTTLLETYMIHVCTGQYVGDYTTLLETYMIHVFTGVILSSPLWGFFADTQGRKKILILSLAADGIIGVLSSFAPTYGIFLAFRFFNGFFICSPAAVVYAYLGEFHNASTRPKAIILVSVFLPLGVVALPGVAWLVIPLTWNFALLGITFNSWRLFVVLCALPSLLTCLLLHRLLPESPKFLMNQGKVDEALRVLRAMYVSNTGNSASKYKGVILYPHRGNTPLPAHWFHYQWLDGIDYSRGVILYPHRGNTPLPAHWFHYHCFNSILLWLPEVFNNMALYSLSHDGQTTTICESMSGLVMVQTAMNSTTNNSSSNIPTNISLWAGNINTTDDVFVTESYLDSSWPSGDNVTQLTPCITTVNPATFQNTLIIGGGMGVINLAIGYIVKWTGRKIISCSLRLGHVGYFAIHHLLKFFLGRVYTYLHHPHATTEKVVFLVSAAVSCMVLYFATSWYLVLLLAFFFVCFIAVSSSLLNSSVVDIFPTSLRAMAVCLTLMAGRTGVVGGSLMIGALIETRCSLAFVVLSGVSLRECYCFTDYRW